MKPFLLKHGFLVLLIVNTLLVLLCLAVFDVYYILDDDVIMLWISSGHYLGSPDFHLVFINAIYGWIVSTLYRCVPFIEWYTIFLLAFHVLSFSIIQRCIIKSKWSRFGKIVSAFAVIIAEFYLILSLTFTTTAGMMATASFLLIYERTNKNYVFGVLLFALASLLRFSSAMLVGIIFLSFYPLHVYLMKYSRIQFLWLCMCVVLAVGFKFVDRIMYRMDEKWECYYQINKARGGINDHIQWRRTLEDLPDNVIESDINLFNLFFFRDGQIFDKSTLKKLHKTMNDRTSYKSIPCVLKIKCVPVFFKQYSKYWIALFPIVLLLLFTVREKKWFGLYYLIPVIALPLVTSMISLDYMVKERAFLCAYLPFVVYSFMMSSMFIMRHDRLIGLSMVMCMLPMLNATCLRLDRKESDNPERESLVLFIKENNKRPILLCWPFEGNVMTVSQHYIDYSSNGWTFGMPERIQIERFSDLVDDENLVIVIERERDSLFFSELESSISFHYGIKAKPITLFESENYRIYKLISE
jgi:hypothetical protein